MRSPRTREGTISVDEIGSFLRRVGLAESEEELLATVRALDEDESGEVSFDEFVAYVESCQVLSTTNQLVLSPTSRCWWFAPRPVVAFLGRFPTALVRLPRRNSNCFGGPPRVGSGPWFTFSGDCVCVV